MNPLKFSFCVLMLLGLAACATEPARPQFVESSNQILQPPPHDRAQVIFLEPINSIQGMIPVGLFEIKDGDRTLLTTTGAHSKVALLFSPGRHLLMANHSGMKAHYLDINVEAGKRYYVLVRFIYANGFQLRPLRPSGPSDYTVKNKNFPSWISDTRFVERTSESDDFFEKNKAAVVKSQAIGWKIWLDKTPQERAELTLNPEDAIPY